MNFGKHTIRNLSLGTSVLILIAYFALKQFEPKTLPPVKGAVLQPTRPLGEFSLTKLDGKSFDQKQLLGKWSVLSFGFTHCPDVCPTTLAYFRDEIAQLSEQERKRVQFIFVTVDPERDTTERLSSYIANFDASIVGLTGSAEAITQAAKVFHAYFKKEGLTPDGLYSMAHSPQYFLINPEGHWQVLYTPPLAKGSLALDLKSLRDYL